MEDSIIVSGHRNPDADAVVSAHVQAWLLEKRKAYPGTAQPVRLGELNPQTQWLFTRAGRELPPQVSDCRLRARDIALPLPTVRSSDTLNDALDLLRRENSDLIAVLDDSSSKVVGLIAENLPTTSYLLSCNVEDFLGSVIDFQNLVQGLPLQPVNEGSVPQNPKRLFVASATREHLGRFLELGDILIGSADPEMIQLAEEHGAAAYLMTEESQEEARTAARNFQIPIFRYPGSLLALASRLSGCFSADAAMEDHFAFLDPATTLLEAKPIIVKNPLGVLLIDDQGRLQGYVNQDGYLNRPSPQLCLVDHCEKRQSIEGLEEAQILEVIDHHRLGDLETLTPLEMDVRPLGSTSSILYLRARTLGIEIPPDIATLLLGALISDTLLLKSPTTTAQDREIAEALSQLAQVDWVSFGKELLRQNDYLAKGSAYDLVRLDCKPFAQEGITFLASQIETLDLGQLTEARQEELRQAMILHTRESDAQFGIIMVTDVLEQSSQVLVASAEARWVEIAGWNGEASWLAEGWVSRKKQVLPYLLRKLKQGQ